MKRTPLYWMSVVSVLLGAASYGLLSPFIKKAYDGGFTFEQVTVHQTGIAMLLLVACVYALSTVEESFSQGVD